MKWHWGMKEHKQRIFIFKYSLSTKLLKYFFPIFLLSIIALLTFQSIFQLNFNKSRTIQNVNHVLSAIHPYLLEELRKDSISVSKISALQTLTQFPFIIGVELYNKNNVRTQHLGESFTGTGKKNTFIVPDRETLNHLIYDNKNNSYMGNLKVTIALDQAISLTKKSILIYLFFYTLFGIVIWFILSSGLKRLITMPLKNIREEMESFDPFDLNVRVPTPCLITPDVMKQNDELGVVARSYMKLRQTILRNSQDLYIRTNELEEAVQSRTAELKTAMDELKKTLDARGEFVATISHEIRTPLNGLKASAELIYEDSTLPEHHKENAHLILLSSQALLKTITNLLEYSKMERGEIKLSSKPLDFEKTIKASLRSASKLAQEKKIKLKIKFADNWNQSGENFLRGDESYIQRMINSIIENILQYSHAGELTLSITTIGTDYNVADIRIEVIDACEKISTPKVMFPLQSLERGNIEDIKRSGSLGLSLSMAHKIATLMDGNLSLKMDSDQGDVFTFKIRLPITDAAQLEQEENKIQNFERNYEKRALIIDDNSVNLRVLEKFLKKVGISSVPAISGEDGITQFNAQYFDIVFTDIFMPLMDGFEVAHYIRNSDSKYSDITIIAITANEDKNVKKSCEKSGINHLLTKPLDKSDLIHVLDQEFKSIS